ncbi:MAG: preprotein translocase subunit SecG [Parcubacteria group bacterium CG08_land_8_20_14_0_20_48_21]|nr:MAG: preprotein translocase subunit SecG [Parcubacteria group bacterium CG2_30_48_51]PIS33130.1 MAG: preprotein translocase subunit SecG [Parcubacteria group bacterium CG08_land_8_20_14_0_20_48_21]PIW79264.1 MAG: preprotein translocase subunit SecG [Parcubacteria group bacterium CG_4_8_14_3_um_filter_48_16]PIY78340.1 MAG: preprotein translocase subunit SecG [Parcubacteria group bacterium CG_4_10_14_0_8_um_filter_48_154]PIZ77714.1 MAG: preprotein translocase subunit SecG [bacterium CG_4_10_14
MLHVLQIVEIILSILLITAILLQNQGSGLGGAFGGEGNVYRTKRGLEKRLFQATIGLAVLFFGMAIAAIFLS